MILRFKWSFKSSIFLSNAFGICKSPSFQLILMRAKKRRNNSGVLEPHCTFGLCSSSNSFVFALYKNDEARKTQPIVTKYAFNTDTTKKNIYSFYLASLVCDFMPLNDHIDASFEVISRPLTQNRNRHKIKSPMKYWIKIVIHRFLSKCAYLN